MCFDVPCHFPYWANIGIHFLLSFVVPITTPPALDITCSPLARLPVLCTIVRVKFSKPSFFINHSCNFNCSFRIINVNVFRVSLYHYIFLVARIFRLYYYQNPSAEAHRCCFIFYFNFCGNCPAFTDTWVNRYYIALCTFCFGF